MYEQTIPLPKAPIFVKSIYTTAERKTIRQRLTLRMVELDVGMTRFHADITYIVAANNKRIVKPDCNRGLNIEQLSIKNMYHFYEGKRSHDSRVQLLDSYLQILQELQNTS